MVISQGINPGNKPEEDLTIHKTARYQSKDNRRGHNLE